MKKQLANIFHLKLLFLIIFFTVFNVKNANCQFLKDEAVWTVEYGSFGGAPSYGYEKIQVLKDSVINGVYYKIFHHFKKISALREEDNQIYYKILKGRKTALTDTLEHILYDFNLNEGDSIYLHLPYNYYYYSTWWHVVKVDTIFINNLPKKRMLIMLFPKSLDGEQYWIEDIGSTYGPLYFQGISEHEWTTKLVCYQLNNKKIYGVCPSVGSGIIKKNNKYEIQYNNNLQQVKIESASMGTCNFNIYTIKGVKINSQTIHFNQNVNVQHLKPGIYIFEMIATNERMQKKIIIK